MLEAGVQAQSQQLRQTCLKNLFLGGSDVIFSAAQGYQACVGIVDRIACAPIAIAGLPHRTGIDQIVHVVFQ